MNKFKTLNNFEKILYSIFLLSIILIFIFGVLKINNILFILISLCLNIFLILIFNYIIKKNDIKFNKVQKILIFTSIICIYIFYFISILNRNFIYYWDYSCYYNIQLNTEKFFNESFLTGIKYFLASTWSGEYGNFINLFSELIFRFTDRTIDSYLLSNVVTFVPYIILSFSILIKKILNKFKEENENILFIFSTAIFSIFPILHSAFIYGQPDLFGLIFIFLIVALSIDYDFKTIKLDKYILLIILTFMLIISRRWYLYFALSYYVCYIIYTLIKNRNEFKKVLKNIIYFIIMAIIFFIVTLLPLIKNILLSNFSSSYEYYMSGGFISEITSQINHLGYLLFIIVIIGIVYGFINKKYRNLTIINITEYLLIIFLFTKVQNMGFHHSLLLLLNYVYFIYLFILFSINQKKVKKILLLVILSLISLTNFYFGISLKNDTKLFTDVPLKVRNQEDYKEIEKVSIWLKNNLSNENRAYMITHNHMYNPDKFRNFYMPDSTISNYLPYGSSIIGVHKFPIELFTAKYIITTDPFDPTSVDEKYNEVFNILVNNGVFKLTKSFDMKNNYNILIYERVESVTKEETDLYLNILTDESQKYPQLYKDVIDEYVNINNIK